MTTASNEDGVAEILRYKQNVLDWLFSIWLPSLSRNILLFYSYPLHIALIHADKILLKTKQVMLDNIYFEIANILWDGFSFIKIFLWIWYISKKNRNFQKGLARTSEIFLKLIYTNFLLVHSRNISKVFRNFRNDRFGTSEIVLKLFNTNFRLVSSGKNQEFFLKLQKRLFQSVRDIFQHHLY